jgi:hypothetical protein
LKGLTDVDGNIYINTDPDIDPTTNRIIQRQSRKNELILLFIHIHELGHRIRIYSCSSQGKPNILQFTPEVPGEAGYYLTDTLFGLVDGVSQLEK